MLFEPEPNHSQLKKEIYARFVGQEVSIEEIEEFVIEETAFLKSHIRKGALLPMEESEPPQIKVHYNKERRRGAYPRGTIIKFLKLK